MRPRTATRAATRSATSRAACRLRRADAAVARPGAGRRHRRRRRRRRVGAFGRMAEASPGKDSVTGHWEMTGVVLDRPFPTFPHGFPADLIASSSGASAGRRSATSSRPARRSSTTLGPEHVRTGAPIVYTSADSVFQIAAHEAVIPLDELYRMCARRVRSRRRAASASAASSRGRSSASPGTSRAPPTAATSRSSRSAPTLLDRLTAAGHRGRRHRQDRGSLRRPRADARDPHDVGRPRHGRRSRPS